MPQDNWEHRSEGMRCETCVVFVLKRNDPNRATMVTERGRLGRCRRHAPSLNGWPAVFESDWCGDHKLDENKVN